MAARKVSRRKSSTRPPASKGKRPAPKATSASWKASIQPKAAKKQPAGTKGTNGASAVSGITPFLWFDNDFEEAAKFYTSLFPNSRITGRNAMGGSFELCGQRFIGLNGGPLYQFTPAVSFFVVCRDQKEVDRLWAALEKDGKPTRCGWIDDKFGLTWQIVPQAFLDLTSGPDPKKTQAVFGAMMGMVKMDVRGLQAAYDAA